MQTIKQAIWFIESHLGEPLTLDSIAEAVGATRFSLSHVFAATTGMTTLGYVRARRLSEAAKALAAGAADILDVALGAGYGSHEAFTRAFRDAFGEPPTAVRERRAIPQQRLTEALLMTMQTVAAVAAPRFETLPAMTLAGFAERLSVSERSRIAGLWRRFVPHVGSVPGEVGRTAYGVSYDFDSAGETFTYLAAVQVSSLAGLPREFAQTSIPAQRWATFAHAGHVSTIEATLGGIFGVWAPNSGLRLGASPSCLERYGADFGSRSGDGGFDVLAPVQE